VLVTTPRRLNDRQFAIYTIATQATLATSIPLILLFAGDVPVAISSLTGGWIATIANAYFALQASRFSGAAASPRMIRAFYRGEAGKFVIVAVLFVAAFLHVDSAKNHGLALILAFTAVHCSAWFVPLVSSALNKRPDKTSR